MENSEIKKRLFIGIDLPVELKKVLGNVANTICLKDRDIRATADNNIHITLKFIGDTNINKIDKIINAIRKTAENFNSFECKIENKIDAFPDYNSARIIFVPIGLGNDKINKIYDILEDNLSKIKIRKEERNFIPHITIARIKYKKNIKDAINNLNFDYESRIICDKLTLFESVLKQSGAEYINIDEIRLK